MRPITESWLFSIAYCGYAIAVLSITAVMIEPLQASFGINYLQMAWLISAFAYTYIFMQLPIGWLMDKVGATVILRIVVVFCSLGCVWFALAGSYSEMLWARAFTGLSASAALPAALYISTHGFSPRYFIVLVGAAETATALSAGICEPVFAYLMAIYSWRQVVLGLSGVGFALTALMWWRLPRGRLLFTSEATPYAVDSSNLEQKACVQLSAEPAVTYSSRQRWRILFSGTVILNGIIAGVLFAIVMFFGGLWSIPLLQQSYGLSHQQAALTGGFSLIGAAVGAPLIGYVATTVHRQFPLLLAGSIIAALLSAILIDDMVPKGWLIPYMFILGVTTSVYVIPYAIAKQSTPQALAGSVLAVVNLLCGGVGALLLVPAVGYLIDGPAGPHWDLAAAMRLFPISLWIICLLLILYEEELKKD